MARCEDCGHAVQLPRYVDGPTLNGDAGEWWCMDCTGESPRERIEIADEFKEENLHSMFGAFVVVSAGQNS